MLCADSQNEAVAGAGTTATLRFLASISCSFVRVQVQRTGTGGDTYNQALSVSSTRVDCRQNRQQDVSITRDGVNQYYVWLVPEQQNADAAFVSFDGMQSPD